MNWKIAGSYLFAAATVSLRGEKPLTMYVNTFLGTALITHAAGMNFAPPWRECAGLIFPGDKTKSSQPGYYQVLFECCNINAGLSNA